MQSTDFKLLPLKEIYVDLNQPRKFYDTTSMQELIDSVREKGILQPILVRPKDKGYMIVCGERRYRAAVAVQAAFKDRNAIPALIRELSDEEALELQIIENLQRKDVHPMEEAVAFKSLVEKGREIHDIALRVGKKDHYVRQRIRLTALTAEWQRLFYKDAFPIHRALLLCMLPGSAQKQLYKRIVPKETEMSESPRLTIHDCEFNKYKGELFRATFDLSDETLDPKMGPCTACQYNTACMKLFPDDDKSPRCMNISCFTKKTDTHFDRELKKAQEDPAIYLVCTRRVNTPVVQKLRKEGYEVLIELDHFKTIHEPEKPDWEEIREDEDTEEQARQEFERNMKDYLKEKEEWEKKVASGKYKKAFVVDGWDSLGKYVYIELKRPNAQQASKAAVASGEADISDIDEEIERIRDREKRAKELDAEKVHRRLVETFKTIDPVTDTKTTMTGSERILLIYTLIDTVGFFHIDKQLKKLGIKFGHGANAKVLWQQLSYLDEGSFGYLLRHVLLARYGNNQCSHTSGEMMNLLLRTYPEIPHDAYFTEQQEAAARRAERVKKRIADLQAKKKELLQEAKEVKSKK